MVVWKGHLQRARPQGMEETIQAKVQEDSGGGWGGVQKRGWACEFKVLEEAGVGRGQGAVAFLHGAELGHPGERTWCLRLYSSALSGPLPSEVQEGMAGESLALTCSRESLSRPDPGGLAHQEHSWSFFSKSKPLF